MSKNVNVFIGVLLCAVLCGTFVWLSSSSEESSWTPNDIYNEVQGAGSVGGYATTSATFSGPSNEGGVALPMSSSSMRARSSYKYAGAYSGASYAPLASSPLASSPLTYGAAPGAGMHLTSSAEIKSFGGGGNGGAAMSGAMSIGRSNSGLSNPSLQGEAGVGISPIAYSTARRGGMSSAAGDDLAMMAAENPVMAMTNAASVGMGNAVYAGMGYTTMGYYGSSSYGSPAGVRGRRNVGGIGDNYFGWLGSGKWGYGEGGENLTENDLRSLYAAITGDTDFSNKEEWDAFYAWFMNQINNIGYVTDGTYYWYMVPLSDAIPFLLLLCAIWALVVYRRGKAQLAQCEKVED